MREAELLFISRFSAFWPLASPPHFTLGFLYSLVPSKQFYFLKTFLGHNKVSNKVSHTAYNAQVGRGIDNYMCSRHDDTAYVRDREKLYSSDVIILSRATLSFYNARLASKLHFPVLIQTHLEYLYIFIYLEDRSLDK